MGEWIEAKDKYTEPPLTTYRCSECGYIRYFNKAVTTDRYKFCPMCGEPLTEPVALTEKELWGMNGRPVYHVSIEDSRGSGWIIADCDYCCGDEEYSVTWLAYTHKPKE